MKTDINKFQKIQKFWEMNANERKVHIKEIATEDKLTIRLTNFIKFLFNFPTNYVLKLFTCIVQMITFDV